MGKNIAILTQPLGRNYGGIIQNYALKKTLENEGYEVETINRIDENPNTKIKRFSSSIKQCVQKKIFNKDIVTKKEEVLQYIELTGFLQNYISLDKPIETTAQLQSHFQKHHYDAVIVGSDQTWRPSYSPNIYNYFLDFLEGDKAIRKIAYATSFGTSDWEFSEEETKRCATLAQQFDAVSVREKSGIDLCQNHLKIKAEWVLDPTFLLKKEDYLQVVNKKSISKRKGLFSYILDEDDEIISLIDDLKTILNMEHFTNQPKWRRGNKAGQKLEDLKYPSLEAWLKAFHDAEFIITDSFHGTVFSIIFNKPFITLVNKGRGAARFESLLSEFGLENRLIEKGNDVSWLAKTPIDFTYANQKLEIVRTQSMQFLMNALEA